MNLQPLGHRVLIKPDEPPTESEGGLVLPQDHDHVSMSGTVVAVGKGSKALWEARRRVCDQVKGYFADYGGVDPLSALHRMLNPVSPLPTVHVGDRVVFSDVAGLNLTVDGERYIILNEDDVVLVESEAVA